MSETQERALFTAGLALQAVQIAELNLNSILTWNFPKQEPIDLAGLSAMSAANLKSTVGRLLTDLRKRANIDPDFDAVLERFVANRNRFAHRLFTEENFELASDSGSERAIAFMDGLLKDASIVQRTLVSFMICSASASGDQRLINFADELIRSPDRPYEIIAGADIIFRRKP